jgi:hypothetical protein
MLLLAAVGGGAFVLASLIVSLRLLALARRTRGAPELLIGLGLLLMGGVGYPLSTTARLLESAPEWKAALFAVHGLLSLVGQGCVATFNWRVFRPGEAWARALALGFVASLAALLLWQGVAPGWVAYAQSSAGPWSWLPLYSLFVLGWAALDAGLYHLKMRRRLALGLADAATVDRLRLWSIAMGAAFTTSAIALALRAGGVAMTPTVAGLVVGPLGIVSAGAMWLAFLPPRRYLAWIHARARAAEGS